MPRYWVIAPFQSSKPEQFDKVWQFDLSNNLISIGWGRVGDVSRMNRDELATAVAMGCPESPPQTKALIANMLWSFYHEIAPGDYVIARRGQKSLAAVGKVLARATYSPGKNPLLAAPESAHLGFLQVHWQEVPRDKEFLSIVFPRHTLTELSEDKYRNLVEGSGPLSDPPEESEVVEDPSAFALEKYLEDFIVSNFGTIFKSELKLYEDAEGNEGQQYQTDDIGTIDILATEPRSNSFVVIELKKGRPSDRVVGQTLRYMGWVKKNLCSNGQTVKGLIICRDPDPKLTYALEMTKDISVRYYSVSFKLRENV
jgi:restriction system protein